MKGQDIYKSENNLSLGYVKDKFPGIINNDTDPIIGTSFIEGAFFNIKLPTAAFVYFNHQDINRLYEFIQPNIGLDAFMNYMNDKFACTGCCIRPIMEGKKFSELPKDEQRRIEQQSITIITVYSSGSTTKEEIFAYFKRLLS